MRGGKTPAGVAACPAAGAAFAFAVSASRSLRVDEEPRISHRSSSARTVPGYSPDRKLEPRKSLFHRGDASKVVRDRGSPEDGHDELDARFARLHRVATTFARLSEMGDECFLYVRPTGRFQVDER